MDVALYFAAVPPLLATLLALLAYALAARLALAAVRRTVRPIGRRIGWSLVLLPLLIVGRAFLTGGVLAPFDIPFAHPPLSAVAEEHGIEEVHNFLLSDVAVQLTPWRQAVRLAAVHGEPPLWNPYALAGSVLAAAAQPAPYHPVNLLALLLPLAPSLDLVAAAVLFLAVLSGFLYCRELGCREEVGVFGGAGWMLSNFILFWLHWPHALTVAVLPLLLVATHRIVDEPSLRAGGLLTGTLCLVLLAGHPESALHVIAVAALYGGALLLLRDPQHLGATVGHVVGAGVGALLVTAAFLLPFAEALRQSTSFQHRSAATVNPSLEWDETFERLVPAFIPFRFGWPDERPRPRPDFTRNFLPEAQGYAGSLLLPLALLGVWRGPGRERFLLAAMLFVGLLAGASAPLITPLLDAAPIFDLTIHKRLSFIAAAALGVLAALGVEAWLRQPRRDLGVLCLATALILAVAVRALLPDLLTAQLAPDRVVTGTAALLLPLVIGGVVALFVRRGPIVVAVLLILLMSQRAAEMGGNYPTLPLASAAPHVAPLDRIPTTDSPFRIVATETILRPEISTFYRLEDARGEKAMTLAPMREILRLWSDRMHPGANQIHHLDDPFLDFLNVRYALTRSGARVPERWTTLAVDNRVLLVENSRVLPRAFVPSRVRLGVPKGRRLKEIGAARDFRERAWIEDPRWLFPAPTELANGPGMVEIRSRGTTELVLDARMGGPGWVVISNAAWSGWRAVSEGEEIPVVRANHAFLAIRLPSGPHRVRLFYRPRSFVIGASVSVITLLGLVGTVTIRRLLRHS